ncbi:MAG TPA: TolC family protein, partial [Verrucomicrobiae bacterium]
PDIASAERQLVAANARIGVARAAYFPVVRLTGSGGYLSADVETLFNWESHTWSIGPSVSLPLFSGGRNRAGVAHAQAAYDEAVATYRQQILVAFAEVQSQLTGIGLLSQQAAAVERGLTAARRSAELARIRYDNGATAYLEVVDAERETLATEREAATLTGQRQIAAVQLIKALGGGWQNPATQTKTTK